MSTKGIQDREGKMIRWKLYNRRKYDNAKMVFTQTRICPRKGNAKDPLRLCDANGWKNRTYHLVDFSVPAGLRVKINESDKNRNRRIHGRCHWSEYVANHKGGTSRSWNTWNSREKPEKETIHWKSKEGLRLSRPKVLLGSVIILRKVLKMRMLFCRTSEKKSIKSSNHIYQPLRSGRIWHKVNF